MTGQLVLEVLEYGLQLKWKSYQREEAKAFEQQGKIRGYEVSQDQILGENHYADVNSQLHTMNTPYPYAIKQP